jgi:hypothetical protein
MWYVFYKTSYDWEKEYVLKWRRFGPFEPSVARFFALMIKCFGVSPFITTDPFRFDTNDETYPYGSSK